MRRRRGQLDPFLASAHPRWLIVSVVGADPVSVLVLPPGTDLEDAFIHTVEDHRAQGWSIENEPTYPCVFAKKGEERRMLTLSHVDPSGTPLAHFSPWRT